MRKQRLDQNSKNVIKKNERDNKDIRLYANFNIGGFYDDKI